MKKQKQSLLVQAWENYEFYLYIPTKVTRNSKPFIFYYCHDPQSDKSARIRRFLSQKKGDKKLIQNEAKEVISELQVLLSGNYKPIRKTYNELKITPVSNVIDCIQHWLEHDERALIKGTIGGTKG
jgi:hypothetical protein